MKKLLNFRPIPLFALVFCGGILSSYALYRGYWYYALPLAAIITALLVLFLILKKRNLIQILCLCLAACISGACCFTVSANVIENKRIGKAEGVLTGTFTDLSDAENGRYYLKDAQLTTAQGEIIVLKGKVKLYLYEWGCSTERDFDFAAGNIVYCNCFVEDINVLADGVDTYSYADGVYYIAYSAYGAYTQKGKSTIAENVRGYIKTTLYRYMESENAALALGLVIGDRSGMRWEDREAFRKSGLAHVFSVSGLHIGFLAAVFNFILSKLNVPVKRRFFIVILPLTAYAYLTGFVPPVVRSLVMTVVLLGLSALGKKSDMLTSLSISALIILAVKPLTIFDAGFLLSVAAVFGICAIGTPLSRIVSRTAWKNPVKNLFNGAFVSLGAGVATIPLVAYFYNEVSLISLFSNLILLPLITVCFFAVIIGLMPLPLFGYILYLPDKVIELLRAVTSWLAQLPYAALYISSIGLGALFLYLLLFVLGGYLNTRGRGKAALCALLALLTISASILSALPKNPYDCLYYQAKYDGENILISDEEGNVNYITSLSQENDYYFLENYLLKYKHNKITVYITHYADTNADVLTLLLQSGKAAVYKVSGESNGGADDAAFELNQNIALLSPLDETVTAVNERGVKGFLIKFGKTYLLLAQSAYTNVNAFNNVSVVISKVNSGKLAKAYQNSLLFAYTYGKDGDYFDLSAAGDFTLRQNNGKIIFIP